MGCESMITSTQLLWSGRTKGQKLPSQVQWYCAISLMLNLGMQIVVAMLGLFAATEVAKAYFDTSHPGM